MNPEQKHTETPRTEANIETVKEMLRACFERGGDFEPMLVTADFARTLEREHAALVAANEEMQRALEEAHGLLHVLRCSMQGNTGAAAVLKKQSAEDIESIENKASAALSRAQTLNG